MAPPKAIFAGLEPSPFVSFGKTRGARLVLAENLTKK